MYRYFEHNPLQFITYSEDANTSFSHFIFEFYFCSRIYFFFFFFRLSHYAASCLLSSRLSHLVNNCQALRKCTRLLAACHTSRATRHEESSRSSPISAGLQLNSDLCDLLRPPAYLEFRFATVNEKQKGGNRAAPNISFRDLYDANEGNIIGGPAIDSCPYYIIGEHFQKSQKRRGINLILFKFNESHISSRDCNYL